MCLLLDIDKNRTTPLRPQSDGMVERYNRTLEDILSTFVAQNQRDWDEHPPFVIMAYRSLEHETTGCSPSELMLGRKLRLPIDLLFSRPRKETLRSPTEYAHRLQERMERAHDFARGTLKIESERQKRRFDHRVDRCLYSAGDAIWLYNPRRKKGVTPKLQRPWEGPHLVTKRISDIVYRIQMTDKCKPKAVHFNGLKPYTGTDPPTWLSLATTKEKIKPTGFDSGSQDTADSPVSSQVPQAHTRSQRTANHSLGRETMTCAALGSSF